MIALSDISDLQWDKLENATRVPAKERGKSAVVLANYFEALALKISSESESKSLKDISKYQKIEMLDSYDELELKKLLFNAWSSEYTLKVPSEVDIAEVYKHSMHWVFPQYLLLSAFHLLRNEKHDVHRKKINLFGNDVKHGHYPESISCYASGGHKAFKYINFSNEEPPQEQVLSKINTKDQAEDKIKMFLKTTREKAAKKAKEEIVAKGKDEKFFTRKGKMAENFDKTKWNLIYDKMPQTTVLDFLYYLRIKSNYHDIEDILYASIDFKKFYQNIGVAVEYMNFVHEAFICKQIGIEKYSAIVAAFPEKLSNATSKKRLDSKIKPLY